MDKGLGTKFVETAFLLLSLPSRAAANVLVYVSSDANPLPEGKARALNEIIVRKLFDAQNQTVVNDVMTVGKDGIHHDSISQALRAYLFSSNRLPDVDLVPMAPGGALQQKAWMALSKLVTPQTPVPGTEVPGGRWETYQFFVDPGSRDGLVGGAHWIGSRLVTDAWGPSGIYALPSKVLAVVPEMAHGVAATASTSASAASVSSAGFSPSSLSTVFSTLSSSNEAMAAAFLVSLVALTVGAAKLIDSPDFYKDIPVPSQLSAMKQKVVSAFHLNK